CLQRIPGHDRGRSLSVAGERRRSGGKGVVGRAKSADAQLHRQVAGSGGDRKTIDGLVRKNFAELFLARLAPRHVVRNEIPTAKAFTDTIAHVQYPTAGGSAAWNADGTGIYYTRFPRQGERPEVDLNFYQQVYFHKLGTPDTDDIYSIGKDFPRIAEVVLEASRDGKYILATVA